MRQKRRSIGTPAIWISIAFILSILLSAGTATGQTRGELRDYLEKTDGLLENARDIIREVGSQRGRGAIGNAMRFQRHAWEAFGRGRLRSAFDQSQRAREEIYKALGSVRQGEDNENEVERQLEHTDRLLQGLRDRIRDADPARIPTRLENAVNMQRRAWDLYRERRLRPALRMTLRARDMGTKLAEDARRRGLRGPGGDTDFALRFDRLNDAIEHLGNRLEAAGNPAALDSWSKAKATLNEAQQAFAAGDQRRADRLLRQAREYMDRAVRLTKDGVRADEVLVLVDVAQNRLDELQQAVIDAGDPRLTTWYDRAGGHLTNARRALEEGKPNRALVQTRRAVALLDKISDQLGL